MSKCPEYYLFQLDVEIDTDQPRSHQRSTKLSLKAYHLTSIRAMCYCDGANDEGRGAGKGLPSRRALGGPDVNRSIVRARYRYRLEMRQLRDVRNIQRE